MIILNFDQWSGSSGSRFIRRRIFIRGRWTPFCRLTKAIFKSAIPSMAERLSDRYHGEEGAVMVLRNDVIGANQESFPLFRCPGCKGMGDIDDDQFHGRVSIDCTNCEYHETKDWSQE